MERRRGGYPLNPQPLTLNHNKKKHTVSLGMGSAPSRRRSALIASRTGSSRESRTAVAQRSCVEGVCPLPLPAPLPSPPRVNALNACRTGT